MAILELKNIPEFVYPDENLKKHNFLKESIDEECHIFKGQYELANSITDKVIENIISKTNNFIVNCNIGHFHIVDVTIKYVEGKQCSGNVYKVNDDQGIVYITIFIGINFVKGKTFQKVKNGIMITVIHELMHGNIFLNRMKSNTVDDDKVDETPENYENILNATRNLIAETPPYYFARGLYLYYYQEAQAMTSQVWAEIKQAYSNQQLGNLTIDGFKTALIDCDVYKDFAFALYECVLMKHDKFLRKYVFDTLKMYKINIEESKQLSLINKMIKKLTNTKKKLINTAYYYFVKEYGYNNDKDVFHTNQKLRK